MDKGEQRVPGGQEGVLHVQDDKVRGGLGVLAAARLLVGEAEAHRQVDGGRVPLRVALWARKETIPP